MNAAEANEKLHRELKVHAHTFNEAQRLFDRQIVTRRTRRVVVEASFLGAYSTFEAFLEEMLYSVLMGESGLSDGVSTASFRDRKAAEQVLTMNTPFLRYLPWKEGVAKTAAKLMVDRGPFGRMDRSVSEVKLLEDARKLRNAVAHRSESAASGARELLNKMPAGRRTVADYLCGTVAGRSSFELHIQNFRAVAACISAQDVASGHRLLLDERPYRPQDDAPRGNYRCELGSHQRVVSRAFEALGNCAKCRGGKTLWHRIW